MTSVPRDVRARVVAGAVWSKTKEALLLATGPTPVSSWRRWAATAAFLTIPAWIARESLHDGKPDVVLWLFLAGLVAAGVGLSRRSLAVLVAARAAAWSFFLPFTAATALALLRGSSLEPVVAGTAFASGAALLLTKPSLTSREAFAAFGPVAYRRTFLAGATAGMVGGLSAALGALISLDHHAMGSMEFAGLVALAVAYVASSMAVVRMRGWGVLLSGAMSVAAVVVALWTHDATSLAFGLGAVPGLVLLAPVVASRLRPESAGPQTATAVTSRPRPSLVEPRIRVAVDERALIDHEDDEVERTGGSALRASPPLP